MLSSNEVIERLRAAKSQVAEIARATKIPYGSLRKIVTGETNDPRISTLEPLRAYFERQDRAQ